MSGRALGIWAGGCWSVLSCAGDVAHGVAGADIEEIVDGGEGVLAQRDLGGMQVSTAIAWLDGSGDVVPQVLPSAQAYVDDGVVGQVGGQDDGVGDRVTQRGENGFQVWAAGSWSHWASQASASRVTV